MGDIHVNAAEAVLEKSRPGKKLKIVLIILITLFLIGVICYAGYEIKNRIEHKKWIEHMTAVVDIPAFIRGYGLMMYTLVAWPWKKQNKY